MAEITNVTKRTIDYYTQLGLLKAERSASNYRYYDLTSIDRVNFIERRKQDGLSLEEIKTEIIEYYTDDIDILKLRIKMENLEKEVLNTLGNFNKLDQSKRGELKNKISQESLSLVQTLLLLLS